MKHQYWIDCPLCEVRMKRNKSASGILKFTCSYCDTVTLVAVTKHKTERDQYRRNMLDRRRIKKP